MQSETRGARWLGPAQQTPTREEGLGAKDVQGLADGGVVETVGYVARCSPYYRGRFREMGVDVGAIRTAADLVRLPLTSKADVAGAGEGLWCVPRRRVCDFVTTSGTTGEPTIYPLSEADLARLSYSEYQSFTCAGVGPADTVLLCVTLDKCFMAGLAYFAGLTRVGAAVVRVGAGSPGMILNLLERLGPTVIVSIPSYLRQVGRYALERRVDLKAASVRKLICVGEPVRGGDMALTGLAAGLEEQWGAKVFSTYGITEPAASACECVCGCGGHVHPETVYFEVLDERGRAVAAGEVGELVATTIGVEAMPVVRFCTGDLAAMYTNVCACGRATARIGPIVGRKNQLLKIKGTTIYPAMVQRAIEAVAGVVDYVLIATSSGPLADELEVVIAGRAGAGTGAHGDLIEQVREHLRGHLKVAPAVRLAELAEVQGLQEAKQLRKKRMFIDRRGTAIL